MDVGKVIQLVLLLLFLVAFIFAYQGMLKRKKLRFDKRRDIDEEEFYQTYYKESGIPKETVSRAIKFVSTAVDIPVSKLRPSDRFEVELKPEKGWEFGDGLAEITWLIEENEKKKGNNLSLPLMTTVDDFIRYVAESSVEI